MKRAFEEEEEKKEEVLKKIKKRGTVYVCGMRMRGIRAQTPEKCEKLNVTSAQAKKNEDRICFSPMHLEEDEKELVQFKGYPNMEAYWQKGKRFQGVDAAKIEDWWKKIKKAKRRYPGSKDKICTHSEFPDYTGEDKLAWVDSRKRVYVPMYKDKIQSQERFKARLQHWKELVNNGVNVAVYDFDGPRDGEGNPIAREVSVEMLRSEINQTSYPFGHGFVVGAMLLNIDFETFCK